LSVAIINPATEKPLSRDGDWLTDEDGQRFPIVGGVPRVCEADNYTSNFGKQWNMFRETQLDEPGSARGVSERRFFAETAWDPSALAGLDVLEVGSGAGRFSQVVLQRTRANLYSVDYSSAVEANFKNNGAIAPGRSL
jgi:SAM-dependent methyltransferase